MLAVVQQKLNEQVQSEMQSSHLYLSIASWLDNHGYNGVAVFFYGQAEEERFHALKIVKFINDRGGVAHIPPVAQPQPEFKSLYGIFELFLASEQDVTQKINGIVELCLEKKDYITYQFIQWYVNEQIEEETQASDLLDELKIINQDPAGLYAFDRNLLMRANQNHK